VAATYLIVFAALVIVLLPTLLNLWLGPTPLTHVAP
jgi:hypothetical protein